MNLQRLIALTWLTQAHAIRNSPAPFLYQTRTLARPLRFRPQLGSSYSTSDNPSSHSAESHTHAESDKPLESGSNGADEEVQSTAPASTPAPRRSFLRKKAEIITKPARQAGRWRKKERPDKMGQKPTLTTHETRALAGLISKLDPEKRPAPEQLAHEPGSSGESAQAKPEETDAEISAIFAAVLRDVRNLQGPPEHRASDKATGAVREETERRKKRLGSEAEQNLDTFTASGEQARLGELPRGAVQTQGSERHLPDTNDALAELLRTNELTLARAIELVAERETAKIDSTLHAAVENTTDEGFWKVCQEKVFSLVQHLSSNEGAASASATCSDNASPVLHDADRTTTIESDTAAESPSPLSIPACVPIVPVVVAIYPKVLRTAFVLLNLHFPDSHLISEFRATITSFGRESATLGLTTSLFNDMLYFHWRVTHDFPEVIALCREMEVTGAQPNNGTINILEGIVRERNEDLAKRQSGETSQQPWWDFPDNRRAMRKLLGEDGMLERFRRQYRESKERKKIWKPYL
ncbi:hypothetical protein BDW60DRAFT_167157 [Aspergillus nidulans var. acristatus]